MLKKSAQIMSKMIIRNFASCVKLAVFLFLVLATANNAFSQRLTLRDIRILRIMKNDDVNSFLTKKGWVFDGNYKPKDNRITGGPRWIYKDRDYPSSGSAAFIISINSETKDKSALYMTFVSEHYEQTKSEVNQQMTSFPSGTKDDCIKSIYMSPIGEYCETSICKYANMNRPLYSILLQ